MKRQFSTFTQSNPRNEFYCKNKQKKLDKEIWIRQVIIPTITDRTDDLYKLRDFVNSIPNITKVELLPYHDLGKYKWLELNDTYQLPDIRPATTEDIDRACSILGTCAEEDS